MLAMHGLNPRPALEYDLFLVSDTRVLSLKVTRGPLCPISCTRYYKKIDVALETAGQKPIF